MDFFIYMGKLCIFLFHRVMGSYALQTKRPVMLCSNISFYLKIFWTHLSEMCLSQELSKCHAFPVCQPHFSGVGRQSKVKSGMLLL